MKILIFGKTGQVGWELRRTLAPLGELNALGREDVDLTSPADVRTAIDAAAPDIIVNAAAYTAVDRAQSDARTAHAVNAEAPGVMAEQAMRNDALLIHYSTDYVFDGAGSRPYSEDDAVRPLGVYGESKLAGERRVLESGARALILRTSWVYGLRGSNFFLTMLRLMAERDELGVVDDQRGAPTWSRDIAQATAALAARLTGPCSACVPEDAYGLYHFSAGGETTWYGFTHEIRRLAAQRGRELEVRLRPITTADYPTPAARPAYSVLSSERLHQVFGIRAPDWRESLANCVADLIPA